MNDESLFHVSIFHSTDTRSPFSMAILVRAVVSIVTTEHRGNNNRWYLYLLAIVIIIERKCETGLANAVSRFSDRLGTRRPRFNCGAGEIVPALLRNGAPGTCISHAYAETIYLPGLSRYFSTVTATQNYININTTAGVCIKSIPARRRPEG